MRFIKNSLSSNLAILGILFNVFYFVSIYQSDVGVYYYNIQIGASVVYNLIFMLAVFLASEGVKNYKKNYSYLLFAIGVMQIVRIFNIPMQAHTTIMSINGVESPVMGNGQFSMVVAFLAISAACLIVSAAVNLIRHRELSEHLKTLGTQNA